MGTPKPITVSPVYDYDPPDTYKGKANLFRSYYATPFIYDISGMSNPISHKPLPLGVTSLPEGSSSPLTERVGKRLGPLRVSGYRYLNPHFFPGFDKDTGNPGVNPNQGRIDTLNEFLTSSFTEPTDPTRPIRTWWEPTPSLPDTPQLRLQRLIVSCFDDDALESAQIGKTPRETYAALYRGLLRKTHTHGSAAPQHFDVMLSIIQRFIDVTPPSDPSFSKLFGTAKTDLIEGYTNHLGLMCSGFAGNFARYGTQAGRPGRWRQPSVLAKPLGGGIQDVDGEGPIRPCPTTLAEFAASTAGHGRARWNLAGQEGANQMGSGPNALERHDLHEVQPGDFICYLGLLDPTEAVGSHVIIIDSIEPEDPGAPGKRIMCTVESASENTLDGLLFTENIELQSLGAGVFTFKHINQKFLPKQVRIRRLNHWTGNRHDLTDI